MDEAPRPLERRLLAIVLAIAALLAINDSLPYLGLRDDSCQTMFSGLELGEDWNNHLFVPQHALSDLWASYELREVRVVPWPSERGLRFAAEWLADEDRDHNTEATRSVVDLLCDAGHSVSLSVRRVDRRGEPLARHEDACAAPEVGDPNRWIPVRLFETDSRAFEAP